MLPLPSPFSGLPPTQKEGFPTAGSVVPKSGTLLRPGATDLVAEAFRRGAACTADFTTADHLAMVEVPLADVRDRFGIPTLD